MPSTPGDAPESYPVLFTESGLPVGSNWSVTVGGTTAATTAHNLTLQLPNGSYSYAIGTPTGFGSEPSSGTFVVSGIPTNIVASLSGFSSTLGVLVDPANHRLYIPNSTSDELLILNATTRAAVGMAPIGSSGFAPLLGTDGKYVYVVNAESNNVSVLGADTGSVVSTITTGNLPYYSAIDPANGMMYIPNSNSNTITVIDTATYSLITTFRTCTTPVSVVPLPDLGEIYVTCEGNFNGEAYTGTLDVIDVATDQAVTSFAIPTMESFGGVYEPSLGEVFLADQLHNRSIVINVTRDSVAGSVWIPSGALFTATPVLDPLNGLIYFASVRSNVSVVNPTSGKFVAEIELPPNPSGGVAQQLAFDPLAGGVWVPLFFDNGPDLYLLNGRPTTISVAISQLPNYFPVWFNETGLPAGSDWSVDLAGQVGHTVTDSVGFFAINGSHDFSVTGPPGFFPTPGKGIVVVSGTAENVTIRYTSDSADGILRGSLSPVSASLFVDNAPVSVSPQGQFLASEKPGRYAVEGLATGYATFWTNATISAGNSTWLNVTLAVSPGSSVPPGGHSSSPSGLSTSDLLWGALGAGVVAAVALALIFWRKRRGPPTTPANGRSSGGKTH